MFVAVRPAPDGVRRWSVVVLFVALLTGLYFPSDSRVLAAPGAWVSGSGCYPTNSSNAADCRNYKLWVPASYNGSASVPLVLMLHGCTQNPDDFAAGTQMNAVADANNFLVVYPEQPSSANASQCWNWFLPNHQARGAGEPAILAQIVAQVRGAYNVDARRMFVAGLSAGAAMTVIMGATYPDLFAAIGVAAGLEYKAGTDLPSALIAQETGGPDPNQQGQLAYQAMSGYQHRMPVIVFHGTLDATVAPKNGDQVISQWAQTNDLIDDGLDNDSVDDVADQMLPGVVPNGHTYTRYLYNDASGRVLMEKWIVDGMRHAWSGGSASGSYTDPTGPNASAEMWRFFIGSVPRLQYLPLIRR